jgi:hypothetical protein
VRAGAEPSFPADLAQQVQDCNNSDSKACQDAYLRVLTVTGCNDICLADLTSTDSRSKACGAATSTEECATIAAPCDGSAGSTPSTGTGTAPAAAGTTQDSATHRPATASETSSTRSMANAGAVAVAAAVAGVAAVAAGLLV